MDESGLTNEIGNADEHLHNHIVENKNINNVYQSEDELTDDYLVTEETYDNIKINDNDNSSDTILVAKPINKQKRTLTKTIVTTTTITYEAFNAPKDMNDCGTEIARTTKIEEILADGDEVIDMLSADEAKQDMERLFTLMSNERYVSVIRALVLEDREPEQIARFMGVTVANLYNIKKRALAALAKVAINERRKYENK